MSVASPRSAYIHVPFCAHQCGYCNFSVVAGRNDLVDPLLDAIATELSFFGGPHEVDTLYFGGGTPTLLLPQQLRQLGETVLQWHPLAKGQSCRECVMPGYEWTVEANPGDLDRARVDVLARLGVNRLSLGAQSFDDAKLRLLERDHEAADIDQAMYFARQAGMRVSLDLIFGTPNEELQQWNDDLDQAIALEPEHISTYGLTFEKGTTFWNRRRHGSLVQLSEELEREMYALAIDRLAAAGYEHYEISNFSRPGCRSRHNESCWKGEGYFAAGPGAARYVDGVRETNHRSTTTYLKRILAGESPVAEREKLDGGQLAHERLVFGLRRLEGVDRQEFAEQSGFEIDAIAGSAIARMVQLGMLADDGQSVRLTREGLFVSDAIWPELL